jgi:hypothetical protein
MSEEKVTRNQLLHISNQLGTASIDDIGKVISLLVIASHHVETTGHPARSETLYVLLVSQKVMEKYLDMLSRRPVTVRHQIEENFSIHLSRASAQLQEFSSIL